MGTATKRLAIAVATAALTFSGVVLGPLPAANAALSCDSPSRINQDNGRFSHVCSGNKKNRRITYTRNCWIGSDGSFSTTIPKGGICFWLKAPTCTLGAGSPYVKYEIG